jgi:hypothetical protein
MKLKRRREQRAATREEKELKRRQVSGELSDAKNAELTKNEATTFGLEPDQSSLVTRTHTLEKDHFSSFTVSPEDAPSPSTRHVSQFLYLRGIRSESVLYDALATDDSDHRVLIRLRA